MTESELPCEVHFGREVCGDLQQAERREWWLSNGRGAYAAGTVAGSLTRRYHGLLVAPVQPPLGRWLLFAKADATLLDGDDAWPLYTNRWAGGVVEPAGHLHLESFHLDGRIPVWRYAIGDLMVEQRIWLTPGEHTVHVAWRRIAGAARRSLRLRVDLLVNARDHHQVTACGQIDPRLEQHGDGLHVVHPQGVMLHIRARRGELYADPCWVENFDLTVERARGLEEWDNHLRVGRAELDLGPGEHAGVVASLAEGAGHYLEEDLRRCQRHDLGLLTRARVVVPELQGAPKWVEQLVLAADSFVVTRPLPGFPDGESVIAGYPWFGDWGRDTMVALPGLTLATGRYESAYRILETFARLVNGGMLPNVFPGSGETAQYNSVDAALWYLEAWRAYLEVADDSETLQEAYPSLASIVRAYVEGTRYQIHVDSGDGLLRAGEAGVQLTWMDAKVDDWVVTPRIGKPVEVNALWYNALRVMAGFSRRLGRPAAPYERLAERVLRSFHRFVRPDGSGLLDVIDGPGGDDDAVRPNQILAVSLPHSPLTSTEQRQVVEACGRELLISYGLRSLAPSHPDYRGGYLGGLRVRDGSYHQGTAWAWLLGHYALAEYRVSGDADLAQSRLAPIADHLLDAGLGTVSEIFDGSPPHLPRGAPSQAWSVGCILEAWWRLERARRGGASGTA